MTARAAATIAGQGRVSVRHAEALDGKGPLATVIVAGVRDLDNYLARVDLHNDAWVCSCPDNTADVACAHVTAVQFCTGYAAPAPDVAVPEPAAATRVRAAAQQHRRAAASARRGGQVEQAKLHTAVAASLTDVAVELAGTVPVAVSA